MGTMEQEWVVCYLDEGVKRTKDTVRFGSAEAAQAVADKINEDARQYWVNRRLDDSGEPYWFLAYDRLGGLSTVEVDGVRFNLYGEAQAIADGLNKKFPPLVRHWVEVFRADLRGVASGSACAAVRTGHTHAA